MRRKKNDQVKWGKNWSVPFPSFPVLFTNMVWRAKCIAFSIFAEFGGYSIHFTIKMDGMIARFYESCEMFLSMPLNPKS
jgi:hypothetical protein